MSEIIASIQQIKNELNEVVSLRKETISKIEAHQQSIQKLEVELKYAQADKNLDSLGIANIETQIAQLQTIIQMLHINTQHHVYDMDNQITIEQDQKFAALNDVCANIKEGNILDIKKAKVIISNIQLDYIKCKHKGLQFYIENKSKLIIYPTIVLLEDQDNSFYIVPVSALNIDSKREREAEHQQSDTAKHIAPELNFSIASMYEETFLFESKDLLELFESKYADYFQLVNHLNSEPLKGIKKEYYETVVLFGKEFFDFLKMLAANVGFINHLKSTDEYKLIATDEKNLFNLGMIDLLKCFNALSDINNLSSNETFSFMYLQTKLHNIQIDSYDQVIKLNDESNKKFYKEFIQSVTYELKERNEHDTLAFNLAQLLYTFDKNMHNEYLAYLFRYANIIMHADGKVTKTQEDAMTQLMRSADAQTVDHIVNKNQEEQKALTLEELLYELYDLTGLQTVKREINTLINMIKIKKAREDFNLKNTDLSLHIVFSGNPGTGKTTVARHLAGIYKCLGVLKKGHLIETDRSGMIAEYVGQTAIKVNKLVDSALDGVLFIDEAYAILFDDKDTYGKEAIATLLKRMEDDRERLIVVLAGYTGEMETFIKSNPGLKSRFNKYIHFPDYSVDELYSIFIGMSRKLHFRLEPALIEKLKLRFFEEIEKEDSSFGNGRFVRNLFERMLENQANRLAYDTELDKEKLITLKEIDLPI